MAMTKWYVIFQAKNQNDVDTRFGVECDSKAEALQSECEVKHRFEVSYCRLCCHPDKSSFCLIKLD